MSTENPSQNPSAAAFFETKYRQQVDPWDFASSHYELRRYDTIVAALNTRPYRRVFEPGCSLGVLTEKLAAFCDAVEAIDFSQTAVAQARQRCAHLPKVEISCGSLPARLPVLGFDLLVLSEIGYYFSPEEWTRISSSLVLGMEPGTTLLAAHWLGASPDHRMHGDQVHAILRADPRLKLEHEERHEGFRLDRWTRA
jgi:SAM-dependent methyltransferase